MRRGVGDFVSLFNGRDGEWTGRVQSAGRGRCIVTVEEMTGAQISGRDLWLLFALVKRTGIDFIGAKATELGVSAIWPVITRHTSVTRVNLDRLRANIVEAAEQCRRGAMFPRSWNQFRSPRCWRNGTRAAEFCSAINPVGDNRWLRF